MRLMMRMGMRMTTKMRGDEYENAAGGGVSGSRRRVANGRDDDDHHQHERDPGSTPGPSHDSGAGPGSVEEVGWDVYLITDSPSGDGCENVHRCLRMFRSCKDYLDCAKRTKKLAANS